MEGRREGGGQEDNRASTPPPLGDFIAGDIDKLRLLIIANYL